MDGLEKLQAAVGMFGSSTPDNPGGILWAFVKAMGITDEVRVGDWSELGTSIRDRNPSDRSPLVRDLTSWQWKQDAK